ncbi:hypothetical protein ACLB2K_075212 [Fragaria x ananassa]
MTVLACEMSSESCGRSVLAPAETNAQGLSKRLKIRYTRSFLVSLANLSTEKGLLRAIEPSVLSELDCLLEPPWEGSNDSSLLSSENVGLLGHGASLGVIADTSQPMVEENIVPLLHKCKEPYRPPHLFKADWIDYKDEVWVSPESLGKNEGCKQNWRREFLEVMREGQKETFQEKQKKALSEQRSNNVESRMPLELSYNEEIIDSLAAEHSDNTANHSKSPATCFEFADQFPVIEKKPAYGISCTEGSELIAHGVSNDHSTKVPDNHSKSTTTDETSQLYGCNIPAVILGVLACVGIEHIFKPETKEFKDGKRDSGNHHGSHHLMLLPEEGSEQKDMTSSSELRTDSITDNSELKFVSKGNAGEFEKDSTQEPSFGTSSTKGLQLTSACTCNRLSSVGRSTRKSVSQACKFFFPIANKNHLASSTRKYKPSVINSEAIVFSSATDQSKGRENQSVSNDLKLNPVCCSDEKDSLPIELCLPDEDSLITVDDFRVVSYKDMLERNQVKSDRVSPSAPIDSSTHVNSVPPVCKGKTSYHASPALVNSQVKAVNPKFKPQNPSSQAFSTNLFPTNFNQSQGKPHQQMFTTTYMPELYQVQAFPWNYQMSGYGCVPLSVPTPGGTNLLGTQNNAGTGYYLGWQ